VWARERPWTVPYEARETLVGDGCKARAVFELSERRYRGGGGFGHRAR
jgi:hypothetical protein